MRIRFGTLVLHFRGLGDLEDLQPIFEDHAVGTDDGPHTVVMTRLDASVGRDVTWYPGQPLGDCTIDNGRVTVERQQWAVHVPLDKDEPVSIRLPEWDVSHFDQAVGTLVQILAPLRAGAVCLHSSSVKRGDEGFAFIPSSETGKTTVARLSKELGHTVLAEEMTYIGWPKGDDRPWVYSLPLRERNNIRTPQRHSAPLVGLYRLRQATLDVVDPLEPRTRFLELAARAAIGARSPVMMNAALEVLERLDRAVETRRLRFTLSTRFWRAIDDDLAGRRAGSSSPVA